MSDRLIHWMLSAWLAYLFIICPIQLLITIFS